MLIIILPVFLAAEPAITAQGSGERPKIGVALSGGGSLGIAHLGLLKVMEEAGLKPDCISGVSMGSVIGGLYSLGYSADSLLNMLRSTNLNDALVNKIPEDMIIYAEKRYFQNSITSFPVSRRKVDLPTGLTNGQVIENFLNFYAWPAADINDFRKLPIPFMCVASDILTVSVVKFDTGYLPQAIRASLAIPSVFTPVRMDSLVLLDGGIYRNFAPSEAIDLGADIVIGSYTGFHWKDQDELEDISDILKQIAFSLGYIDFEQQKKLVKYLIMPDLKGYSSMDFSRVDSIFMRGYKAAAPFREKFRRLADSLNSFGPQEPVKTVLGKKYYIFDRIEINGNVNYSDRQVMGILGIQPGDSVDQYMMREKTDLLYGTTWFDKVEYRIVPGNDSMIMVLECREKPVTEIFGSVHYDNVIGSGIILSMSAKNFILPGSQFNLDTYIGRNYRVRSRLLQYIGWRQATSIAADLQYDRTHIPLLHLRENAGAVTSGNFSAGLTIGKRFGLNNMFGLSGVYENLGLEPRYYSATGNESIYYNYFRTGFKYGINTLDTKHFPNRGTILDIEGGTSKLISASIRDAGGKKSYDETDPGDFLFDRYYTLKMNFRQYVTRVRNLTFSFHADVLYLSRSDSALSRNNFYLLGGINQVNYRSIPMTGFSALEIPVQKTAGMGIEFDLEPVKNLHFNIMADVFAAEDIYRDNEFRVLAGIGAGAGYMSILGPIKAGIMFGRNPYENYFNSVKGYVTIGFYF
ncbi:MAG: patatin-like phospholipase family protein [Bacteroidales bacterium]|jgi:NTE family protein|nr:patatin-like phospholipase family protein [Bacteroidales bacterium]